MKSSLGGRATYRAASARSRKKLREIPFVLAARATTSDASMNTEEPPSAPEDMAAHIAAHLENNMFMTFFHGYNEASPDAAHLFVRDSSNRRCPQYGGKLLSILNARQAQMMVSYLINKALEEVILTGFTFDARMITDALVSALRRGVDVIVVLDFEHTLDGPTKYMMERMSELKRAGVKVLVTNGITSFSGLQHSKTVLCDHFFVLGSCNWTFASQTNHEMDVLLYLDEVGLAECHEHLRVIMEHSMAFDDDMERHGRESREKRAEERDHELDIAHRHQGSSDSRARRSPSVPRFQGRSHRR